MPAHARREHSHGAEGRCGQRTGSDTFVWSFRAASRRLQRCKGGQCGSTRVKSGEWEAVFVMPTMEAVKRILAAPAEKTCAPQLLLPVRTRLALFVKKDRGETRLPRSGAVPCRRGCASKMFRERERESTSRPLTHHHRRGRKRAPLRYPHRKNVASLSCPNVMRAHKRTGKNKKCVGGGAGGQSGTASMARRATHCGTVRPLRCGVHCPSFTLFGPLFCKRLTQH